MGVLRGSGLTSAGADSLQGVLVQACSRRSGQVPGTRRYTITRRLPEQQELLVGRQEFTGCTTPFMLTETKWNP